MAPRIHVPKRQGRKRGSPRLGSLRTALLILAVVPSVALVALWAVSTAQLGVSWQKRSVQHTIASQAALPATDVFANLQQERRLSALALADPEAGRSALDEQRARTDKAVRTFQTLSDIEASDTYPETQRALAEVRAMLPDIAHLREEMDSGKADQQHTYEHFTSLIAADIRFFEAIGATEDIELNLLSEPLNGLTLAVEAISRQDALMARSQRSGQLSASAHSQLAELVGVQRHLFEDRIEPYLSKEEAAFHKKMVGGNAWKSLTRMQNALVRSSGDGASAVLADGGYERWEKASGQAVAELNKLVDIRVGRVWVEGEASAIALLTRLATSSALGLGAVVLVIVLSVWLTSLLRRRVLALREEALTLERKLPEVVERLRRGEDIDVDAEVAEISHGDDELGRLGQALNTVRRSAISTAVRETEQHRGFERLLQRIARRTQLLIGLQLKKLDEMERRHEDPEVLEGLFDLDHLTARLRRYEENLVILGGGQPQRRWRKPVRVLNILRAALGEVQDYRRIHIEVEGQPWLSERAVGPVVHILAELMENATAFSKPPTPVEVRAGLVGRGLVVEIEDRGLGMEPEEYDRANRLMSEPPRMDMMSRADDVRLGLYVVARLAGGLGVDVELRPSVFGGTRAIVLVPAELVADGPGPGDDAADRERTGRIPLRTVPGPAVEAPAELPVRSRGRAMNAVTSTTPLSGDGARTMPKQRSADGSADGTVRPLPKRVRQASLVDELRKSADQSEAPREAPDPHPEPARSGAAIGAFQRQSRARRQIPSDGHPPTGDTTPGRNRTTTEDAE